MEEIFQINEFSSAEEVIAFLYIISIKKNYLKIASNYKI